MGSMQRDFTVYALVLYPLATFLQWLDAAALSLESKLMKALYDPSPS
jgi:hypothetical protein